MFLVSQSWSPLWFLLDSAEGAAPGKYVVQNGRSVFRVISKIVRNTVQIPSQNSSGSFSQASTQQLKQHFLKLNILQHG